MKEVWISNEIFRWYSNAQGSSIISQDLWKRSYEIWDRGSKLIEKNEDQFDLVDGISNLKRSLNHRLMLVEDLYHFKDISFKNKPKGYLELLQCFNLIRPMIMKALLHIRNNIEHNDAMPPELSRCKELVDVVWYFHKSTDSLVQLVNDDFGFNLYNDNGEETYYEFTLSIDYNNHRKCELAGWFPIEMISLEKRDTFFKVQLNNFNGKEVFTDSHKEKLSTDKWVNGIIFFDGDDYVTILSKLLSLF